LKESGVGAAKRKNEKGNEKMTLEVEDEERETLSAQDDIPRHARLPSIVET
jgi:hypothetical protein